MNGTIARILQEKGFGFVKGQDSVERFFHRSAVGGAGFDMLVEGQKVTFDHEDGPKGPRATNVFASAN